MSRWAARHRLNRLQNFRRWGSHRVPQIPVKLAVQPEFRRGPEKGCQSECRIRSNPAPAADYLVNPWIGDLNPLRQIDLAHVERLQEFLQQHLSGMSGRAVFGEAGHH